MGWRAAHQDFAHEQAKRKNEATVLKNAKNLDPQDNSTRAQTIRETAEDIQDRRASERWNGR